MSYSRRFRILACTLLALTGAGLPFVLWGLQCAGKNKLPKMEGAYLCLVGNNGYGFLFDLWCKVGAPIRQWRLHKHFLDPGGVELFLVAQPVFSPMLTELAFERF